MSTTPTKEDLIRLVGQIQNGSGCMIDMDALLTKFERSVPNPAVSQWIFDPPAGKRKTPAEIVELAFESE